MLPRRQDGAADLTEALDSLLGAQTPRDLLVQLPQAEVSLRLMGVTGHVHLVHTGQPFPLVGLVAWLPTAFFAAALAQIVRTGLLQAVAARGLAAGAAV
jgi:hypothetical protein